MFGEVINQNTDTIYLLSKLLIRDEIFWKISHVIRNLSGLK